MGIFFQSDSEILSELESQINAYYLVQLKDIQNDVERILQDAIQTNVYDYYPNPNWYERTYELKNSVRSDIKIVGSTYILYVYIDTDLLNYNSAYNKSRNVSSAVPYWIESGHNARNYLPTKNGNEQFYNEFHSYEARNYLEEAFELINDRYGSIGLDIEIINDVPSYV